MPSNKPARYVQEPLRVTFLRTGLIAIAAGGVASIWAGVSRWPAITLLALWPSFGGHWVEVFFLACVRPRIPNSTLGQGAARLAVWFAGGSALVTAMGLTARILAVVRPINWPVWWIGGLAFVGLEVAIHLALRMTTSTTAEQRR